MAGEVYINVGTSITFTDDDTVGTYTLDLGATGGGSGEVAISDQADLGAHPRASLYRADIVLDGFATAPVVGQTIFVYLAEGRSTTDIDGDLAATAGSSSTAVLPNLRLIATAVVQTTTAADELRVSAVFETFSRYITLVVYNSTADALATSGDAHTITLTPIAYQGQ